MKNATSLFLAAASLSTCVSVAQPASPQETAVTTDDVLMLMDRVPAQELCKAGHEAKCTAPYKWSKVGQANRIAWSIAHTAKTREQAAHLVVYDIRESNNRLWAVGDSGKSHGPWQLSVEQATVEVATDPDKAAPIWLYLADKSRKDCAAAGLPEDEQLAQVASGNCDHGRRLAARRAATVRQILSE
jgi:hypothetical protein